MLAIFAIVPYAILPCVILTSAAEFRHWRSGNSKELQANIFSFIQTCQPITWRIAMFSYRLPSLQANQIIQRYVTLARILLLNPKPIKEANVRQTLPHGNHKIKVVMWHIYSLTLNNAKIPNKIKSFKTRHTWTFRLCTSYISYGVVSHLAFSDFYKYWNNNFIWFWIAILKFKCSEYFWFDIKFTYFHLHSLPDLQCLMLCLQHFVSDCFLTYPLIESTSLVIMDYINP